MKDSISITRLSLLHPRVRKDFQDCIDEWEQVFNITIRIVQGLRTFPEQDAIYQIGRTVKGENAIPEHPMGDVVSNSPAGTSYHNYGLAVDVVPIDDAGKANWKFNYARIANIAAQWNITWGGNFPGSFKDYDHFELKLADWHDLLAKYRAGDFIPGTQYVQI